MEDVKDQVTGARVDVEMEVAVPRERLWDLITDVSRIGEWSPECFEAGWLDGSAPGARVGARFAARNRYPDGRVRSVVCEVTEARRPETFAWVVLDNQDDPERPGSFWSYRLLPGTAPGTTLVRHSFMHGPGMTGARKVAERDPAALDRRLEQLRGFMTATLTAISRSENPIEEGS